jgi:hypothetical protein
MSAAGTQLSTTGFPPLGPEASDLLINRTQEAQRISAYVAKASSKIVVLCGQSASGKTVLVKRWLIPALRETMGARGFRVYFGECTSALPKVVSSDQGEEAFDDAMARKSVVVVDEFDRVFDAPRDERRQALDHLFEKALATQSGAIVVLVVSVRHLTAVYGLSSYYPQIASAVFQVQSIGLVEGLQELNRESPDAITITPAVYHALSEDWQELQKRRIDVTFGLLRLIHDAFGRQRTGSGAASSIDLEQYENVGRLTGVLRDHIDHRLRQLPAESARVARAILWRIREAQSRSEPPDLAEIAPRLEVSPDDVRDTVTGLTTTAGLLRLGPDNQFEFEPPQIVAILDDDVAARRAELERLIRIVEEGLRSRQTIGSYLPAARFAEVEKQKRYLVLDDDITRFLAQCAIRYDEPEFAGSAKYWIKRVKSRQDRIDILVAAALEEPVGVRGRAVALLADYSDPLVRDRLCVLALTETTPSVRAAAIESLRTMADTAVLERVLVEVHNPNSPSRENAVEALSVFPRPDVTVVLQSIVDDPDARVELRVRAVSVLAALNMQEAVDVLVKIALDDPDTIDRESAANALASASSAELNHRILERLDWRRPTVRITAALTALAIGLLTVVMLLFGAIGESTIEAEPFAILFLGLLALAVPLGMLLARLQDGRLRWRSSAGGIAIGLFWISALVVMPYFHGMAHALIRRWKRFAVLLGLEVLGLVVFFVVADATEFVPRWGGMVANFYRTIGGLLIVGTYLYDVLAVALELFVLREAQLTEQRRSLIYRAVFRNPAMADAVFYDLRSEVTQHIRRAQKLLRHFGSCIAPAKLLELFVAADPLYDPHLIRALKRAKDDAVIARLEALWAKCDGQRQRAIVAVLARKPTARSIEALQHLGAADGIGVKLRAAAAGLHFRVSVWSWPARLAALSALPVVFVLIYHAMKVKSNPAWAPIVLLRQPLTDDAQQVKIVNFLADAYPGESVEELRTLFQERAALRVTPVQAALARGLVTIHDSLPHVPTYKPRADLANDMRQLRDDVFVQLRAFNALLSDSNRGRFDMGLGVLTVVAASADSELSAGAITHLVEFAAGNGALSDRKRRVLDALGGIDYTRALGIDYTRALPALDRVLEKRQADRVLSRLDKVANVTDTIHRQIDSVAWRAYGSMPKRSRQSAELLALLERLSYAPPSLIEQIRHDATAVTGTTPACDRNGDRTCDGKDEALNFIAAKPLSEQGYIDLFGHYGDRYSDAAAAFARLSEKYPSSIWPRRFLVLIYHEYLSPDDPEAFGRSYEQVEAIRRLAAFRRLAKAGEWDYVRLSSDFVEVALTAGHYEETERRARELLGTEVRATTPTTRYNMTLFPYIASVLRHDTASASVHLAELERLIPSLPNEFYNNWIYPGTLAFIDRRKDLSPGLKKAMSALCKGGDFYPQTEALRIMAENRSELTSLATNNSP